MLRVLLQRIVLLKPILLKSKVKRANPVKFATSTALLLLLLPVITSADQVSSANKTPSDKVLLGKVISSKVPSAQNPSNRSTEKQIIEDNSTPTLGLSNQALEHYRQSYQMARKAYSQKDPHFYKLKHKLSNYPLFPYLQYSELVDRISEKPYSDVDNFLESYGDSYLGQRLLSKWLKELARVERWHEYQSYYRTELKSTMLQCLYLQARSKTSKAFFPEDIQKIWLSGRSQPDACDPLFKQWQQQGHLSQELLWQRHQMAIKKGNKKLARFLQQKMNSDVLRLAKLYQQIYANPEQIKVIKKISGHPKKVKDIIYDGLHRHAYYQPVEVQELFKQHQKNYPFEKNRTDEMYARIATNLARKGHIQSAKKIIDVLPDKVKIKPIERLLRKLLKEQQWQDVYYWVNQLPAEARSTNRWQYWKARALENIDSTIIVAREKNTEKSNAGEAKSYQEIYSNLAKKRSFYGFLSADKVQQQYDFEHKPVQIIDSALSSIKQNTSLKRAKELFLLGKMHDARQEWRYGIKGFSAEQLVASAQLANNWGWHRKAIEAMAGAKNWDDLSIRFPVVYENIIDKAAESFSISPSLVFAIARQESAWEFDARSRVGATGLMQLMPATAREAAKKVGIKHHKEKLIDPQHNITLGSHYISYLLEKYDNNRLLAIAAYNAGPHRVSKWLQQTERRLPYDVWIEIIPFKETRRYVQNVLTYGVVYNYRRGQKQKLIALHEAKALL